MMGERSCHSRVRGTIRTGAIMAEGMAGRAWEAGGQEWEAAGMAGRIRRAETFQTAWVTSRTHRGK